MKKISLLICAVILSVSAATLAQSPPSSSPITSASPAAQKYTCPMHPEVVQDKPGNCPKCGMKLVPKEDKKGGQTKE